MVLRGRLIKDPELAFSASGMAYCRVTVVDQPQKYDKEAKKWVDLEATFWDMTLWREEAENAAEGLSKGDEVIVVGRPITDTYTGRDGAQQKRMKFQVEGIAVAINRFQSVKVLRAARKGQSRAVEQPVDPWGIDRQSAVQEPPF